MRIYKFISVDIEILTHPEIAQGALRQRRNDVKRY
jgi:hypothetical protein